jgi:hypothetical protein
LRQDKEEDFVDRLKRLTDLFVEGAELNLGDDEAGPVLVWINKLNSFEDDEARRDGLAARTERLLQLTEDHAEMRVVRMQMEKWDVEEMATRTAQQKYEEDYLLAIDDIESDKVWAEKLDFLRRAGHLHGDANLPEDDSRREQFEKANSEYFLAVTAATDKRQKTRRKDLANSPLEDIHTEYVETMKQRLGMEVFLQERKVTEIYYALRDCTATITEGAYDHTLCDHRTRLLPDRRAVRDLPSNVITRIVETLDQVTVDRRTAGNSDAPVTSSESSEQPKPEEESVPSTQEVKAPVVART